MILFKFLNLKRTINLQILLLEDAEELIKNRQIGLVNFLGELYNSGVLNKKIITLCCIDKFIEAENERYIEYICILMKTIKKQETDFQNVRDFLNNIKIHISSRTKFVITDVLKQWN